MKPNQPPAIAKAAVYADITTIFKAIQTPAARGPSQDVPWRTRALAHRTVQHVLQVTEVVLLNRVGLPGHLKHVGRVHLVLDRNSKVVRKLPAVDGGRHEDDLQSEHREEREDENGEGGKEMLCEFQAWLLPQQLLRP